jgi:hypothetical protein
MRHQRSSEVIRGHHASTCVIMRHQRSSPAWPAGCTRSRQRRASLHTERCGERGGRRGEHRRRGAAHRALMREAISMQLEALHTER